MKKPARSKKATEPKRAKKRGAGEKRTPEPAPASEASLFVVEKEEYGEDYREHLLEQYKLFVESSLKVTEWRQSANTFLLAINTSLVTAFGIGVSLIAGDAWRYAIGAVGILLCIVWWVLIRSYKHLNRAKFAVVHELETRLPAALFGREWRVIRAQKKYSRLTSVESWVPFFFALFYVALIIVSAFGLLPSPAPR